MPNVYEQFVDEAETSDTKPKGNIYEQFVTRPAAKPSVDTSKLSAWEPSLVERARMLAPSLFSTRTGTLPSTSETPAGLVPRISRAVSDIPKIAELSPAELYPEQKTLAGGAAKELLGQANLENLALITGVGEVWKAAKLAKDTPKIAALTKALIGAYFSTQGAKGAGQLAGKIAGTPAEPAGEKGQDITGIGLNALMTFAPLGETLLRQLPKRKPPTTPTTYASEIQKAAAVHGDLRTQPISRTGPVSLPESRGGIQPQAEGRLPQTPQGPVLLTADAALARGPGGISPAEIASMPEAEYEKLTKAQTSEGAARFRMTPDATAWALKNPNVSIPEMEKLRDEQEVKDKTAMVAFKAKKIPDVPLSRWQWFADAIHALKKDDVGRQNIATVTGKPVAAPAKSETITAAAFRDASGTVHTGTNHPEILQRLGIKGFETDESRNTPQFGFVTDQGRLISREQAGPIAEAAGQNLKTFAPGEPVHATEIAPPAAATEKVQAEVSRVATTEGQRPAKEVKSELVQRLEKAISKAPAKEDFEKAFKESERSRDVTRWPAKRKVTINIPGDGNFTVANHKEALGELLERAKRLDTRTKPPKNYRETGVGKVNTPPPAEIKTVGDWNQARDFHELKGADLIYNRSNALNDLARLVNPERPETVTMTQVENWIEQRRQERKTKTPEPAMVGMGAALKGETTPTPETPTSIKNRQVDIERQKRGLPPAIQTVRRSFGKTWDEAMAKLDRDPGYQDELINELKTHPRAINDMEDAVLLHRQIHLQNQYGSLTRELAQAYDDAKQFPNRLEDVEELKVRVAGLSDQMLELYDINKFVGTETARGLSARRMMAFEDYSLAKMELDKRAANGGRPLTDAEHAEIQKLNVRITDLQKRYDDYVAKTEARQTTPVIQQLLDAAKQAAKPGQPKELPSLEDTKQKIGAKLQKGERAEVSGLVQKLVRAFVEENPKITRDQLVDQVHAVLREFNPDIERREAMDAISGYGDFKPLEKDAISVIVRDLKGQLQQIGKLEDMAAGTAPRKTGLERRIPTDEERRLIKQVEEAKRRGGYKVTDPATQLRTALQSVKTRLENQIKDLEHQISTRQKILRVKTPLAYDAQAGQLKARRDELKAQYDEIFPRPELTDAQRLEMWKKRTQNRITELQGKLAARDFSRRPVRPPPELDDTALRLKAELDRTKQAYQRGLIQDRLKARPWWIKAQDTFLRWYRGGILSSPVVFAKLTAAAIVRAGLTPLEEAVGAGLSRVVPKLAAHAPREGYWNSNAEAKAIRTQLTKGPKTAWQVLRTGEMDIDVLYGKGREGAIGEMQVRPFSVADIPGRTHAALKAPTKQAEFERSLEKRLAYEIRNGVDVSHPAVQLRCAVEAYKDAQRSIFLQDNLVVSAYNRALRGLEQPSKLTGKPTLGGKAMSTVGRTLVPIVRVPSNIVGEAFQFATGSVTGSARLGRALRTGIDTLPPEQADLIMRELKKGSIGGAAILVGFLLPNLWGGFYQRGEKRKPSDVKASEARIPGVPVPTALGGPDVPQGLLHHPVFETVQAGATIRRVADKNRKEGDLAIPIGVEAASLGLVEETPFIREMVATGAAFDPNQRNAFFAELTKSITEPQLMQWLAKQRDVDVAGQVVKRKPKTFGQHLEMGVPGLRENVPLARTR